MKGKRTKIKIHIQPIVEPVPETESRVLNIVTDQGVILAHSNPTPNNHSIVFRYDKYLFTHDPGHIVVNIGKLLHK